MKHVLIEQSQALRLALKARCDQSALLKLKLAATIFQSRLIVEEARARVRSVAARRQYREMLRAAVRLTALP